jgi:hypothetical protein
MAFWLEDGACEREGVDTNRMVVGLRRQGLTKDLAYNDQIVQIGGRTSRIGRSSGQYYFTSSRTFRPWNPWILGSSFGALGVRDGGCMG